MACKLDSSAACGAAALVGQALGVAAWLVEAHIQYSELSTTTLQQVGALQGTPSLCALCSRMQAQSMLMHKWQMQHLRCSGWDPPHSASVPCDDAQARARSAGSLALSAVAAAALQGWLRHVVRLQINPALTGGCFSLGVSTILTVVLSLIFPQHYDWVGTRTLSVFNDTSKDVRPLLFLCDAAAPCLCTGACCTVDGTHELLHLTAVMLQYCTSHAWQLAVLWLSSARTDVLEPAD